MRSDGGGVFAREIDVAYGAKSEMAGREPTLTLLRPLESLMMQYLPWY